MTATHHIVIAAATEAEAHRKDEGDIIETRTIKEVNKRGGWGRKEVQRFLMIPAKGLTDDDIQKLRTPIYEDDSFGELEGVIPEDITKGVENLDIAIGQIIDVKGWGYQAVTAGKTGAIKLSFAQTYDETIVSNGVEYKCLGKIDAKRTGKRRYQIPLDILKTGWKSDLDTAKVNDKSFIYQPLIDDGVVVDFAEKVAIAKDKVTDSFKYIAVKRV